MAEGSCEGVEMARRRERCCEKRREKEEDKRRDLRVAAAALKRAFLYWESNLKGLL